jgi:hypothetical protein
MADIVITEVGPLWTLAEVKTHLHVDDNDQDVLIAAYMEAAEKAMLRFCNLSLVPFGQEAVFKIAGLQTVAAFFEDREGDDQTGMPRSARSLIWPYRWLPI